MGLMMGSRSNTRRRNGVDGPPFLLDNNRTPLLNFSPKISSFSASLAPLFFPLSISRSPSTDSNSPIPSLSLSPPFFFRGGLRALRKLGSLFSSTFYPFFYRGSDLLFISFVGRPHMRLSLSGRNSTESRSRIKKRGLR